MIWLTGDVHHASLRTKDQDLLNSRTEVDCARRYVEIANRYAIRPTLFVSGRAVLEEPQALQAIDRELAVDWGGHTFDCFSPISIYRASHLLLGKRNGPTVLQRRDISRTVSIFKDVLGVQIRAWRSHAYRLDERTPSLLREHGIRITSHPPWSLKGFTPRFRDAGLHEVPVNVPPDHENLVHGGGSLTVGGWVDEAIASAASHNARGNLATLLCHPACMWIADEFRSFERLCEATANLRPTRLSHLGDG